MLAALATLSAAGSPSTPSSASLQASLRPGEVLIAFSTPGGSDPGPGKAELLTRGVSVAYAIPARPELERRVGVLVEGIRGRDGAEVEEAVALHRDLLGPASAPLVGATALSLVLEDPLHALPFAALRASPEAEPLGLSIPLDRHHSLERWLGARRAPRGALRESVLVVGDGPGAAEIAAVRPGGEVLAEPAGGSLDDPARGHGVVHLGPAGIGLGDLGAIDLRGRLVVLGAPGGDGPPSLLDAGAIAVVSPLWTLADRDAAALYVALYDQLDRGRTPAEAISGAQRALEAEGHPARAWAGLVVTGDGSRAPMTARVARDLPEWTSWVGMAIGALAALALALRKPPPDQPINAASRRS